MSSGFKNYHQYQIGDESGRQAEEQTDDDKAKHQSRIRSFLLPRRRSRATDDRMLAYGDTMCKRIGQWANNDGRMDL